MNRKTYIGTFAMAAFAAFIGLFVPLMDNDAAHHANIAMRMFLTGDYVNLVDNGTDYLDKPHLHFWLAALSYKIFGINGFAYKFPSFIISIGGVYSVYRLGVLLYDVTAGKLSALIFATSFSFMLSLSDVRMDAILVSAIAFSCWQLTALLLHKKWSFVFGAALGLATGFSVKGNIGVFVPLIYLFFYLLENKQWKSVFDIKWVVLLLSLCIMIAPVLYCYYQQFNLHPEKTVRGLTKINGVTFILFGQSIERVTGHVSGGTADPFFFVYTFLWAFAPWSLIVYFSATREIKKRKEWFLAATLISIAIIMGISGSKLPHYLNICFPFASLMAAAYLQEKRGSRFISVTLYSIVVIILICVALISVWVFPSGSWSTIIIGLLLFIPPSMLSRGADKESRPVLYAASAMIFLFLILNTKFYFPLLEYQGGQVLAEKSQGTVLSSRVYFWPNNYSSSYCFASEHLRQEFSDSVLNDPRPAWIIYDNNYADEIRTSGYQLSADSIAVKDFEITKLDRKFLDPRTRDQHCGALVLRKISRSHGNQAIE